MQDINDLRESLFEAMQLLKQGKIDVSKAKAIAELGQVIVNSAKAEVDFMKEAGGMGTGFIAATPKKLERPKGEYSNDGHLKAIEKYG